MIKDFKPKLNIQHSNQPDKETSNMDYNEDDISERVEKSKRLDELYRLERHNLRRGLDNFRNQRNHFLAISTEMGTSRSYISSAPLSWFADVHFASDLEVFREHHDERGKSVDINEETLGLLSQRMPDWSRQLPMAVYLSVRRHRKFPAVLLVAYQKWVFDPDSDEWAMDKRALRDSVTRKSLDSENLIIDFNHSKTQFYALDGQHRLMAVKGLRDMLDGSLARKKKNGEIVGGKSITIEDIRQFSGEDVPENEFRSNLNSIMEEKIGVEIIPAVQMGETKEEAFARLRQIFVDVNQNAKPLNKGELALLDETEGFRIVSRQVMVSHGLFRGGRDGTLLVDTKNKQLSETSDKYTTLETIVKVSKRYLGQLDRFGKWETEVGKIKGAGWLRPEDGELRAGREKLSAYFDSIMTLPSHREMIKGRKNVRLLRGREKRCNDNVLFRPIAQEALAEAVGELEENNKIAPKEIIKKLSKKDDPNECYLRLTNPASPFFGVLCDPVDKKMRHQEKYKKLATRMFIYLLGGGVKEGEKRERLRKDVFNSRRITDGTAEVGSKAIGYDGSQIEYGKFQLPSPW